MVRCVLEPRVRAAKGSGSCPMTVPGAPRPLRPWVIRRFDVAAIDPGGRAARAGRAIEIEDRYFPLVTRRLAPGVELARVHGHLGIHTDRRQDQNHTAYYPWHEGMIWNLVLWADGGAAALLGRGRRAPHVLDLVPGLALWLDITETAHGITALLAEHPERHPEVVMVQVLGTPSFLYDAAIDDAGVAIATMFDGESIHV